MTRTSMINEYDAEKYLRSLMEQGKDVVHVSFASACSGTVNNFLRVAEKLNKEYSNKVYVVDSMAESGGQGLLVVLTDNFAETGKSAKEVYDYAMEMRNHVCHYFCVDSIKYLARGGRVSKVAGFIGSLINIKPVLYTDPEGKLTALNKEITRKRSLNRLVELYAKEVRQGERSCIYHLRRLPWRTHSSGCRTDRGKVRSNTRFNAFGSCNRQSLGSRNGCFVLYLSGSCKQIM